MWQYKLDVVAPGMDCGGGCILQQGEHGQVAVGFVDHVQMHVCPAMLEAFPVKGLEHGSDTAVPAVCVTHIARSPALDPLNPGLVFGEPGRPHTGSPLWAYE